MGERDYIAEWRSLSWEDLYGRNLDFVERVRASGIVPGLCGGLGFTVGLLVAGLAVYESRNSVELSQYDRCVAVVDSLYQEGVVSHGDYGARMDECSVYLGD